MKTTIEINGYEVVIEETEGVLTVKAQKDEETIEEFEIDTTEEGEGEGVQAFGEGEDGEDDEDFEDGEDFEGEDFGDEDFEDGEEPAQEEETKLESFNSFIQKRK
jgi:hypothetical protein